MYGRDREILSQGPERPPRVSRPFPRAARLVAAALAVGLGGVLLYANARAAWPPSRPAPSARPTPQVTRVPGRAPTAAPTAAPPAHPFVPATRSSGGRTRMDVTFPDGSTARIAYPQGLRIAELGARPYSSAILRWRGGDCCGRVLDAPPAGEAWYAAGGPARARFAGAGGTVTVYPPPLGGPSTPYLVYRFGRWSVGVAVDWWERMDAAQQAAWAAALEGAQTADGFLVLRARSPLRLTRPGERLYGAALTGPQVRFGGWSPVADSIVGRVVLDRAVVLEPVGRCAEVPYPQYPADIAVTVSRCASPRMRVWAGGPPAFTRAVLRGLRVERFTGPPGER